VSKKLLISDANIIIDIVAGELVDVMFSLNYEFGTPDILYVEELEDQHSGILNAGLKLFELKPESIDVANSYYQKNIATRVSANDCLALSLAQQEECALLTGDSKLKQLAIIEGITVHGTLWLVDMMFNNRLISVIDAENAYRKMLNDGSRLPEKEIKKQLIKFSHK